MSRGNTHYVETPWGLFTQQQLVCLMGFYFWSICNTDFGVSPEDAVSAAIDYYSLAWPLIEGTDL